MNTYTRAHTQRGEGCRQGLTAGVPVKVHSSMNTPGFSALNVKTKSLAPPGRMDPATSFMKKRCECEPASVSAMRDTSVTYPVLPTPFFLYAETHLSHTCRPSLPPGGSSGLSLRISNPTWARDHE